MVKIIVGCVFAVSALIGCAGSNPPLFDGHILKQSGVRCYQIKFPDDVEMRVSFVEQSTVGEPTSFENTRLESKEYNIKISHGLIEGGHFRSKFSTDGFQWVRNDNVLYAPQSPKKGDYADYVIEWRPEGTRKLLRGNLVAYGQNGKQVLNLYLFWRINDNETKESIVEHEGYKKMINYMEYLKQNISMVCVIK